MSFTYWRVATRVNHGRIIDPSGSRYHYMPARPIIMRFRYRSNLGCRHYEWLVPAIGANLGYAFQSYTYHWFTQAFVRQFDDPGSFP